ncbi:hypothetical protein B0T16DRAFT_323158 [Cercophora newfieldiana]|uniref:Spo12-like protein n=1 Tax=Cercophora newfieldiana TaxID=92897 RepID=A0AA39YGF8_9PEZI|nr:hypothetical protein B0T16DRAFT_323158 [Cercophora newfieldiana]
MSASNVLAAKDVNMSLSSAPESNGKGDVKSMEYHRQVLQSKMEHGESKTYISPSDNIMSPCTAKLSALRNKQVGKVKPKSLFAQASAKKLEGDSGIFGAQPKAAPATPKAE